MPSYQKLVRDRIPEIIEAAGKKPVTHILDEAAYLAELDRKLSEECAEYQESKSLEEFLHGSFSSLKNIDGFDTLPAAYSHGANRSNNGLIVP